MGATGWETILRWAGPWAPPAERSLLRRLGSAPEPEQPRRSPEATQSSPEQPRGSSDQRHPRGRTGCLEAAEATHSNPRTSSSFTLGVYLMFRGLYHGLYEGIVLAKACTNECFRVSTAVLLVRGVVQSHDSLQAKACTAECFIILLVRGCYWGCTIAFFDNAFFHKKQ